MYYQSARLLVFLNLDVIIIYNPLWYIIIILHLLIWISELPLCYQSFQNSQSLGIWGCGAVFSLWFHSLKVNRKKFKKGCFFLNWIPFCVWSSVWIRGARRFGMQSFYASVGVFGSSAIGMVLIVGIFLCKDWKDLLFVIFGSGLGLQSYLYCFHWVWAFELRPSDVPVSFLVLSTLLYTSCIPGDFIPAFYFFVPLFSLQLMHFSVDGNQVLLIHYICLSQPESRD